VNNISIDTIIKCYSLIDQDKLINFYPEENKRLIKEKLKLKLKALKALCTDHNDKNAPTLERSRVGITSITQSGILGVKISQGTAGVTGCRKFSTKSVKNVQNRNKKINDKDYIQKQKTFTLDLENRRVNNYFIHLHKDQRRLIRPSRVFILKISHDYLQFISISSKDKLITSFKKHTSFKAISYHPLKAFVKILIKLVEWWKLYLQLVFIKKTYHF
jgi:hypothetical protein